MTSGPSTGRPGGVYDMDDEPDPSGEVVYEPMPAPRRGRARKVLGALLVLAILGLLAAGAAAIWLQRQIDPPGEPGAEVAIVVPEGATVAEIAAILDQQGVVSSARVFRLYVRVKGASSFRAGEYVLREDQAFDSVIAVLEDGPEYVFRGNKLTIPEGFTLKQIAARVGSIPGLSSDRFLELTRSGTIRSLYQPEGSTNMEGLLYPDTYLIEEGLDEAAILQRMVDAFDTAAAESGIDQAGKVGFTPYQAIVAASLIERETRFDEERAKVSQVIQNRLAKKMRLEMDATVVYALGGGKTRVLFEDLKVDSPYNTYRIDGLPPTPIASPSRASLAAAVNPEPGPWIFYVVTETDGRHSFAVTLAEHNANIRKAERNGVR